MAKPIVEQANNFSKSIKLLSEIIGCVPEPGQ
jgi:hypothetical protein